MSIVFRKPFPCNTLQYVFPSFVTFIGSVFSPNSLTSFSLKLKPIMYAVKNKDEPFINASIRRTEFYTHCCFICRHPKYAHYRFITQSYTMQT